jgi:hypothetical protein
MCKLPMDSTCRVWGAGVVAVRGSSRHSGSVVSSFTSASGTTETKVVIKS